MQTMNKNTILVYAFCKMKTNVTVQTMRLGDEIQVLVLILFFRMVILNQFLNKGCVDPCFHNSVIKMGTITFKSNPLNYKHCDG